MLVRISDFFGCLTTGSDDCEIIFRDKTISTNLKAVVARKSVAPHPVEKKLGQSSSPGAHLNARQMVRLPRAKFLREWPFARSEPGLGGALYQVHSQSSLSATVTHGEQNQILLRI